MIKQLQWEENRKRHLKSGHGLEKIIEIEPEGKTGGKIVWEWHL